MQKKLTLRIEDTLIDRAKAYAEEHGKSVSQMVADFFAALDARQGKSRRSPEEVPPITRSLQGILKGSGLDEEDYYRHLEERHR